MWPTPGARRHNAGSLDNDDPSSRYGPTNRPCIGRRSAFCHGADASSREQRSERGAFHRSAGHGRAADDADEVTRVDGPHCFNQHNHLNDGHDQPTADDHHRTFPDHHCVAGNHHDRATDHDNGSTDSHNDRGARSDDHDDISRRHRHAADRTPKRLGST
jgi:hypothetical protein